MIQKKNWKKTNQSFFWEHGFCQQSTKMLSPTYEASQLMYNQYCIV